MLNTHSYNNRYFLHFSCSIKHFFSLLALFCLTALFCTGCRQHKTPVEIANREKILLIGNSAEPASLDPHFATTIPEYNILLALFEGLIIYHPETLQPQPAVAERWEISEDSLKYTFFLRHDARWSHGQPVHAEDFVFSYRRALSPELGCPNATQFYVFKNAQAYHKKEIDKFEDVGVKALDHYTLELTLENPTPHLLALLCSAPFYPVHPATIIQHHALERRHTAWTRPGNLVSNGPFMLFSSPSQGPVEVVQNSNYWHKEIVELRKIRFFPIQGSNCEELAFRAGQLHVTDTVPMASLPKYIEENSPYLKTSPLLGLDYYAFNTQKPPFDNAKVRQAFNLAINRKDLVHNILKDTKYPAYFFTPPNVAGYNCTTQIVENVNQARSLLAEAGYPKGQNFPKVEILFNSSDTNRIVAEAIQSMLLGNLGIPAELINQEYKVYLSNRTEKNFFIARCSWMGDYVDPSTFLSLFISNSGNNRTGWSNPNYDHLIKLASETTDNKKRYQCFQDAEALLLKDLPIMPLFFYKGAYLIQTNVEGWYPNILDLHPYQYVRLKAQ